MTEKRFKSILNDIGLRDEKTGKDYIYFNPEIVDLINNITSENEQLKQQILEATFMDFQIMYRDIEILKKENGQLKLKLEEKDRLLDVRDKILADVQKALTLGDVE